MFVGDNKEYAINNTDGLSLPKYPDNNTMRDPKYVVSNGQAYLTIEASTSYDSGNQGINNFYNKAYFGMTDAEFVQEQQRLLTEGHTLAHDAAYFGNAALGLLKIDNNFNVTSVEKPLVTANAVSDEIERPNLFEYDGKWYLFATTRSWHMASNDSRINTGLNSGVLSFMIGFVSEDGIQGHYKPLNGNGLVVASDTPLDSATYAFLVLPNADKTKNQFVTTAYLGVRTFAPSFLLEINGDKTKVINNKVLNQGALVDDGVYFDAKPQTVVKTDNDSDVTPTPVPTDGDKPSEPSSNDGDAAAKKAADEAAPRRPQTKQPPRRPQTKQPPRRLQMMQLLRRPQMMQPPRRPQMMQLPRRPQTKQLSMLVGMDIFTMMM
ncbi:Glucan-binding domain (YG repeat) [Fructobacillus fructosus]|nr:Glucan-binding domain (YG repeat) [Fructobacillus fructosus]CAK1224411.1 Glucan-binding domain (YG repeat) [Fructobacillus fructosus]CAK1224601.1 Glucan-binding domain (YG repeat) [Fructobacillus fructosus]